MNGKFDTLHIFGSSDEIINPKRSKALMNYFTESDTREMVHECMHIEHNGGHLVPSDKHVRDAFKEFLGHRRRNNFHDGTFPILTYASDPAEIHH